MGFFKDFKNDMKQAVNELIPDSDEMAGEYDDEDMVNTLDSEEDTYVDTLEKSKAPEEENPEDIDLSGLEDIEIEEEDLEEPEALSSQKEKADGDGKPSEDARPEQEKDKQEAPVPKPEEKQPEESKQPAEPVQKAEEEPAAVPKKAADVSEGKVQSEPTQVKQEEAPMAEDKVIEITSMKDTEASAAGGMNPSEAAEDTEASDSTTYISKGTRIEGNLFTDGSVDVIGTVDGDVSCYGKLIASGAINGKVNASEVYANAAKITGEITSTGSVKIGVGSVIVGNVDAQSAVIAGAVNGDLDIKGPVIVDSTAVIMGNIKSRSVQINNGAVIEGFCSQCYSDVDVKSFFA